MEIDFENVEPLLESVGRDGNAMVCEFRCPVTGKTFSSRATIRRDDSLVDNLKRRARRDIVGSLQLAVSRAVRSVLGRGIAGQTGSSAGSVVGEGRRKVDQTYSQAQKDAAVVEAFERVSSHFTWDATNERWICNEAAKEQLSDFRKQVNRAPVIAPYDARVLARMMVEIARADGHLDDTEREFVSAFLPPEVGTVEQLSQQSALSRVDLEETSPGPSRETILMLAWTVAMTDKNLHQTEAARLEHYRKSLGIPKDRSETLRGWAQSCVLGSMLDHVYVGGARDDDRFQQVMDVAWRLGISEEEAERVDVRYRKRHHIF